jgi:short-subunit dehydrogenase
MQLNFFSAVRCTQAVLPELTRSSGVLVNIGSLASKTAWPLMAPYAASKHALSAYTHQLRLEGPANVHFLHVCPGPIKRADAGRRYDAEAGTTKIPEAARRAGAGAKVSGIEPLNLARRIVSACERRQSELLVPWHSRFLFAIAQLSSTAGDWLLRRFMS